MQDPLSRCLDAKFLLVLSGCRIPADAVRISLALSLLNKSQSLLALTGCRIPASAVSMQDPCWAVTMQDPCWRCQDAGSLLALSRCIIPAGPVRMRAVVCALARCHQYTAAPLFPGTL